MKPLDATKHMNALNKVINGSQQIIDAIDSGKEINVNKAIKAAMFNNKIIAEELNISPLDVDLDRFNSPVLVSESKEVL